MRIGRARMERGDEKGKRKRERGGREGEMGRGETGREVRWEWKRDGGEGGKHQLCKKKTINK